MQILNDLRGYKNPILVSVEVKGNFRWKSEKYMNKFCDKVKLGWTLYQVCIVSPYIMYCQNSIDEGL